MDKTHFSGFFLEFSAFYYTSTSGAFPCGFFFEKSRSNILGIYASTPQTLLEIDPQNSNFEESSEYRGILCASKLEFAPATSVSISCIYLCSWWTLSFYYHFCFGFWIHIASAPITPATHTDGGAVIRKPGSARLEGTPAMDHGHDGKRIHMYSNKRETEQNTHQETRNMDEQHTPWNKN